MRLLPYVIAFLLGMPFGALLLSVKQTLRKRRDRLIAHIAAQEARKMRVGEVLNQAETDELITELSNRDLSSKTRKT